jgi:chemotaxis protein CheD
LPVPMSAKVYTIGISGMTVCAEPEAQLVTYALGSCIAVLAYDPAVRVGGLLHFQLPESKGFEAQSRENPYKFGDAGIPAMMDELYQAGANRNRLEVSIFGGASMLEQESIFQIGVRNARMAKKMLWQGALFLKHEDVGGTSNRTVSLDIDTGRIRMKKDGQTQEL